MTREKQVGRKSAKKHPRRQNKTTTRKKHPAEKHKHSFEEINTNTRRKKHTRTHTKSFPSCTVWIHGYAKQRGNNKGSKSNKRQKICQQKKKEAQLHIIPHAQHRVPQALFATHARSCAQPDRHYRPRHAVFHHATHLAPKVWVFQRGSTLAPSTKRHPCNPVLISAVRAAGSSASQHVQRRHAYEKTVANQSPSHPNNNNNNTRRCMVRYGAVYVI